ncbi:MAG: YebC/PmpR family DNA-binding transcriptional regulator [Magnetospiraceae bacterium]
MAGHSKFKNIMYRKGAQDKKRAKEFAKLSREIIVAAKIGGGDPDSNARLRSAIIAARSQSMPKDNIERAIKRGTGETGEEANYEEVRYEGYGPGGVALIVEALTDNRNRTAAEVRTAFAKNGGNMGETGSVAFMFERVGRVVYPGDTTDNDSMFEAALEAGASDVASDGESHEIICDPNDLNTVRDALAEQFGDPESAGLDWKPSTTTPLEEEQARTLFKLIEVLDDNDDVQSVSANFDVSDEIMERLSA